MCNAMTPKIPQSEIDEFMVHCKSERDDSQRCRQIITQLQAELKRKYKGCCDDCFVVTEPQKENIKLKAKIVELEGKGA